MNKKNKSKLILFCAVIILSFLTLYLFIAQRAVNGEISFLNSLSMHHYRMFTNNSIEINKIPEIKTNGNNYIFGECKDSSNYRAYKGNSVTENTVLYGKNDFIPNGYWAAYIVDGEIKAIWTSNYPLTQDDLIQYDSKKAYKQLNLFEIMLKPIYKTKIVGYFES